MRTFSYPPDIEAEITFVPTEQGGRKTPAFSGYRPQFYYDGMIGTQFKNIPMMNRCFLAKLFEPYCDLVAQIIIVGEFIPECCFKFEKARAF